MVSRNQKQGIIYKASLTEFGAIEDEMRGILSPKRFPAFFCPVYLSKNHKTIISLHCQTQCGVFFSATLFPVEFFSVFLSLTNII